MRKLENGFNGIVLVADHGIKMLEKPVGKPTTKAVPPSTLAASSIASMHDKMFTAIVVMQLTRKVSSPSTRP